MDATELQDMKIAALIRRAANTGAAEADIDAATEGANPKEALIRLIMAQQQPGGAGGGGDDANADADADAEARARAEAERVAAEEAEAARVAAEEAEAARVAAEEAEAERVAAEEAEAARVAAEEAERERLAREQAEQAEQARLAREQAEQARQAAGAELAAMKMSALRKRALELGVDRDAVDDAADEDEPKAALIQLIMAQQQQPVRGVGGREEAAGAAEQARREQLRAAEAQLRADLEGMKASALMQRARDEGVEEGALEAAMDGDTPKAALIQLIVNHKRRSEFQALLGVNPESVPPRADRSSLSQGGRSSGQSQTSPLIHQFITSNIKQRAKSAEPFRIKRDQPLISNDVFIQLTGIRLPYPTAREVTVGADQRQQPVGETDRQRRRGQDTSSKRTPARAVTVAAQNTSSERSSGQPGGRVATRRRGGDTMKAFASDNSS